MINARKGKRSYSEALTDEELEQYLPHYDDYEMTREQKLESIGALADILKVFVDEAWGDSPFDHLRAAERREEVRPKRKGRRK
ncbi:MULTISPECIES: hypothetical protein [Alphaproteobacteria]|uniref:hypothetical protein n=1 Tax=Alphaproteobacteria TaxID=28211 RepID=UPI00329987E1